MSLKCVRNSQYTLKTVGKAKILSVRTTWSLLHAVGDNGKPKDKPDFVLLEEHVMLNKFKIYFFCPTVFFLPYLAGL